MADIRRISKKKKFIADGVFKSEVHEFFSRAITAAGYAGLSIKNVAKQIVITVKVVNKKDALGENGVKANELEVFVEKRFGFPPGRVQILFETIRDKSLCAAAQAEYLKVKLTNGAPVRSAAMFILRNVCRKDIVKGCEVIVSGKLRQQRAKTMKYKQGYLISTGQPKNDFIDVAIRHVFFTQGMMGIKVKILLPSDPSGKMGPKRCLPDKVKIRAPTKKDEEPDYNEENAGQAPAPKDKAAAQ